MPHAAIPPDAAALTAALTTARTTARRDGGPAMVEITVPS
jgi:hypothetical protein